MSICGVGYQLFNTIQIFNGFHVLSGSVFQFLCSSLLSGGEEDVGEAQILIVDQHEDDPSRGQQRGIGQSAR